MRKTRAEPNSGITILLEDGREHETCHALASNESVDRQYLISTRLLGMGIKPKWARETIVVPLTKSQLHIINPANPGGALDNGVSTG